MFLSGSTVPYVAERAADRITRGLSAAPNKGSETMYSSPLKA